MRHNYSGAEWLRAHLEADNAYSRKQAAINKRYKPRPERTLSALGARGADLLGFVYRGLYHIGVESVDWGRTDFIEISVRDGLATFDSQELTELVVLCHAEAIRLEIKASGPRRLKLWFSPRVREAETTYERHPTLAAAVEIINKKAGLE